MQELDRAECKTAVAEKLLNSEELDSMDSEKLVSEQPVSYNNTTYLVTYC